jgi:prepilin peptidase CpaA
MMQWIHQAALTTALFLFCLAVIYGALSDVRTYTIPNRVSYGLALLFLLFAALRWQDLPLLLHLGIGLLVFIICLVFWQLRWMGGGDAKFVAAISLWMGPQRILLFMIFLALLSTVFVTLLRLARTWNPYFQGGSWPGWIKLMVQKAEENAVPYGLPAGIAALATMFMVDELIRDIFRLSG